MHLIIDHFDSFTYNLVQMLAELTRSEVKVVRHDALPLAEIVKLPLESIVFSPGPGIPDEYPESQNIIRALLGRVPILGVCLGHELLVAATGGRIRRGNRIMHGKTDEILQDGRGCFRNLPSPSHFVRYHSLVADPDLPECLEASAWSRLDGDIMAVRHRTCQAEGLQFHPESIGSELGRRVMLNFLNYRREPFPARKVLGDILHGDNIGRQTAYELMLEMAEGNISDARLAGFLCALEAKGPTAEEIAGSAAALLEKCEPFQPTPDALDIVGIGGDGKGSFNLSSMASLAAAACGQKVAKHGNRAVSSFCGSADFFGELGYPLAIPPRQAEHLLADTGFVFLYAPTYHSAMKHAAAARRELAIRTLMNLLGPLANPSRAGFQLLGVPEDSMLKPLADAAMLLGGKRVMTIHSEDGLDEFSCAAPTHCLLREAGGETREFVFQPSEVGIRGRDSAVLKGGTAEVNAAIALDLMQGRETGGMLEAACLNAGAGLFVAGATPDIASGYHKVRQAFAAGQVGKYFTSVITRSQELAAVPA